MPLLSDQKTENESPSLFMDDLVNRAGNIGVLALDETMEKLIEMLQEATQHVEEIREIVKGDRTANTLRTKANELHATAGETVKHLKAAFSEATSAMNRESNFDTAFSKVLPRELQGEILFRYAQSVREHKSYEVYHDVNLYEKQTRAPRYLLDIMLVCSTWLHIARTDPRLWTVINFAWCRRKIEKYLTLSKNAGLRLTIPTYNISPLIPEKSKLLMKHINRARGIEFYPVTDFESVSRGWGPPELPRKPAAVLHILEDISNENLAPLLTHLLVRDDDRTYTLPSRISLLSLKTLVLRGCLLKGTWAETLPTSLQEIHVLYSNIHAGGDDILTMLRRCSKLEVVVFSDNTLLSRQYKDPIAQIDDSVISVESLRKLKPWPLSRDELEHIFNTYTFHRLSEFNITLEPSTGSTSPPIPTYLRNRMASSTSLELRVTYDVIKVIFSDSQSTSPKERHSLEVDFRGEIICKETLQSRWYANLDEIVHSFKNVTDLKIHQHPRRRIPRGTSRCIWPSLVTALSGIPILEVGGVIDDEMFEILGIPGQLSEVSFPSLVYLRLGYEEDYYDPALYPLSDEEEELEFSDSSTSSGSFQEKRIQEAKHRHDLLLTCLSNRMTAGAKLSRLVDSRCIWIEQHAHTEELNPESVLRFVDVFESREPGRACS
ncbi:hypothetical protein SISNIDRAFT_483108 [Sistotremastrum niveocremeum HHB9708]|uniref:F-box domain-containing protein n=1 Tax=Sistotremastrum niveocremeum HHB9708 TaxID=1314777 RepID=A0A164Y3T3_9AGAM|nr:hypothetical protein SISNIDRAFT_483108 [Sistotremastrum niveocremeum HHB9708]